MEFAFDRGSDLRVSVNGEVLGGVISLERAVKNDAEKIYEFLTDKPVARLTRPCYELVFVLHCENGCVFSDEVRELMVEDRSKTEVYTACTVKRLVGKAGARGNVEVTAVVEADERSVTYE